MPKRDPEHMRAQKERILRAVIACVAERGVERTSIADICGAARLSAGALYVHFASKEEIITAAVTYASTAVRALPETWKDIVDVLSSLEDQMGFDIITVIRCRAYLQAESLRPGSVHDAVLPGLRESLDVFTERLEALEARGEIRLRLPARQAAFSMAAYVEGMLWLALSTEARLEDVRRDLRKGLDCFVEYPPGDAFASQT